MYILESQKGINIVMQDQFEIVETIMNTIVSVYYLFIIKFIQIFTNNKIETKKKTVTIKL